MCAPVRNDANYQKNIRQREQAEGDPEVQQQVRVERMTVCRSIGGKVPETELRAGCCHDGRIPGEGWWPLAQDERDSQADPFHDASNA